MKKRYATANILNEEVNMYYSHHFRHPDGRNKSFAILSITLMTLSWIIMVLTQETIVWKFTTWAITRKSSNDVKSPIKDNLIDKLIVWDHIYCVRVRTDSRKCEMTWVVNGSFPRLFNCSRQISSSTYASLFLGEPIIPTIRPINKLPSSYSYPSAVNNLCSSGSIATLSGSGIDLIVCGCLIGWQLINKLATHWV